MKKGLIFVLFALVSIVSYSQISWNAKVGMNMSNFTGDADTDMRVGFNVGVGMEYQFTDMWSIQPSLMFTQKGAKLGDIKANPIFGDDAAKRFDFGLGMGVAYEINRFFVDLSGEFGLVKMYDGDGSPKNINFSIGVGYKF